MPKSTLAPVAARVVVCFVLLFAGLANTPAASSSLVADINQVGRQTVSFLTGPISTIDGQLVLSADDGLTGPEPWISDGTSAGTQKLVTVNRRGSGGPSQFVEFGGGRIRVRVDECVAVAA